MDWTEISKALIEGLAPLLTAGLVALIGFATKYFVERIRSSNNATILMLAGVAVRYAETKFGPDTGRGREKEQIAVDFLVKQIKGLNRQVAENFVKAAYSAAFTNIAPLGAGAVTLSGTPYASSTTSLAGN